MPSGYPRGMARSEAEIEPALVWAVALFMAAIAAYGSTVFTATTFIPVRFLPYVLQWLAGTFALLGVGVAGAMGEPLPANPRDGYVPWRLRLCWGILGLCPRPGRALRATAAAAFALLYLFPFEEAGVYGLASASALAGGGALLAKPKSSRETAGSEWLYVLGLAGVGLGALAGAFSDDPLACGRSLAVLAGLVLLAGQRSREVCAARWAELLPGIPPPPALDLSRYELTVERRGPAERAELPPGVESQLVDTGSFKVDAAKMLDKLREYQLEDPADFLCAWLRCAAASGAAHMRLTTTAAALELGFDGRPFSASELSQPYQALVDAEGLDGRRGRHFAYGLLGLYRLRPRRVSVTSRGPDGVAVMKAGSGGPPDPAEAPEGTVIRVAWPAWAAFWRPYLLARRAVRRYGLGPATLTVDGKPVPDRPSDPGWTPIDAGGWRGVRRLPMFRNRVRLYVLGTLIEELEGEGLPSVEAWLTHDDLELDISQSSVVRGRRLESGLELL